MRPDVSRELPLVDLGERLPDQHHRQREHPLGEAEPARHRAAVERRDQQHGCGQPQAVEHTGRHEQEREPSVGRKGPAHPPWRPWCVGWRSGRASNAECQADGAGRLSDGEPCQEAGRSQAEGAGRELDRDVAGRRQDAAAADGGVPAVSYGELVQHEVRRHGGRDRWHEPQPGAKLRSAQQLGDRRTGERDHEGSEEGHDEGAGEAGGDQAACLCFGFWKRHRHVQPQRGE